MSLDQALFMSAFGLTALVNGEAVQVIVDGENRENHSNDFDMTDSSVTLEIQTADKAKFTKGSPVELFGQSFSVYREPVLNLYTQQWEVELEP